MLRAQRLYKLRIDVRPRAPRWHQHNPALVQRAAVGHVAATPTLGTKVRRMIHRAPSGDVGQLGRPSPGQLVARQTPRVHQRYPEWIVDIAVIVRRKRKRIRGKNHIVAPEKQLPQRPRRKVVRTQRLVDRHPVPASKDGTASP